MAECLWKPTPRVPCFEIVPIMGNDSADFLVNTDLNFPEGMSRSRDDWREYSVVPNLTSACWILRHVAMMCRGGDDSFRKLLVKPRPRPRLQPVIRIEFIMNILGVPNKTQCPSFCVDFPSTKQPDSNTVPRSSYPKSLERGVFDGDVINSHHSYIWGKRLNWRLEIEKF